MAITRKRTLASLRMLLSSGIDLMTQMPVLSEEIKRLLPSFSLSMIRVDERGAPHEHYSEYFDEASHQLFSSAGHEFAASHEDPAAFGYLLRHPKPYGTLIDLPPGYLEGATYQHLFKRNGIHHVMDLALRDSGGPLGILGIFREKKAPPFTRADVVTVSQIYGHLVHACAARPTTGAFDETEGALVVTTRQGQVRWLSPLAKRWLEDASGGVERARLMEADMLPEACRRLCRLLEQNQAGPSSRRREQGSTPATMTLPVAGGRLRLRAYDLFPGRVQEGEALVGIQLHLELHRGLRLMKALSTFDLPPQLRQVAWGLWNGLAASEIASTLGVTASTMKSYRKELYARLEVDSHDALLRLLDERAQTATLDLSRHRPRLSA